MVWGTFSHRESERLYGAIECPVLIVTGEHSMAYWNREGLIDEEAEEGLHEHHIKRRASLFRDARHRSIDGAGHMLHYDQPQALAVMCREFLEEIYE